MSNYHVNLVNKAHLADIPNTKWGLCKNVLRCIADHANEDEADMSWPGVELLMLETGVSESSIGRATALLEQHGWLAKKRRSNRTIIYRINVAKLRSHQVARPGPNTVFMDEHLDESMRFADEDETPASHVPGRSTARKRAQKRQTSDQHSSELSTGTDSDENAPDQATRQSDGTESSICGPRLVNLTGPIRQIDELTLSESLSESSPNPSADASDVSPKDEGGGYEPQEQSKTQAMEMLTRVQRHHGGMRAKPKQHAEIVNLVAVALDAGHKPTLIERELGKPLPANTVSPVGIYRWRILNALPEPEDVTYEPSYPERPCGECDGREGEGVQTRTVFVDGHRAAPCPRCHPRGIAKAAA